MRVRNGHGIALCALLALTGAWLLYETRATTFWFDEWIWVLDRRGNDVGTFLDPHNGHLSLVPVAIYKLLFATAGLTHYWPYRVLIVAAHLGCVVLVFAYARPRVGFWGAALAGILILFLGPGWQNILWPFQIGSVISLLAGVGALMALDRRDRAGDVAACLLLAVSLASSSLGVVMAVGVTVDLLVARRRPRELWIVAAPLLPYALWWLVYQDTDFVRHNVVLAPGYAADAAAGVAAALTGLTGDVLANDSALAWGRPLAVAAAGLLAWRLFTIRPLPPRAITLIVTLVAFWLLTAVQRAGLASPVSSRYVHIAAVLGVLLIVELARGVAVPPRAAAFLAVAAAAATVANAGDMRDGARYLREQATIARADLTALELSAGRQPPGYIATQFPGTPLVQINGAAYVDAARDLGSPALTPQALAAAPEPARQAADRELVSANRVALTGAAGSQAGTAATEPGVDAANGGTLSRAGGCVTFRPDAVRDPVVAGDVQLTLPPAGLRLTTGAGAASVSLRRFAAGFPPQPLSRISPGSSAELSIPGDGAAAPWHVRIAPDAAVTACTGA